MEKSKKVKITLGLFYLLVVSSFLYFFLSKFTLEELTSYEFIKNNRDYFFGLKQANLFLISLVFLISRSIYLTGLRASLFFTTPFDFYTRQLENDLEDALQRDIELIFGQSDQRNEFSINIS